MLGSSKVMQLDDEGEAVAVVCKRGITAPDAVRVQLQTGCEQTGRG